MLTENPSLYSLPELELPAAEAVLAQVLPLREHARALSSFILEMAPRIRAVLEPEIVPLPALAETDAFRLAAVDSASRLHSTVALTALMVVAFKTSATRSEDARAVIEHLDESHEQEAIARVVRAQLEAELLSRAALGRDELVILDNSFISLAENASRAELARSRVEAPLAREVLERYCRDHLGPDGSLLELLSNVSVIALPKIAEAQALVRELYERVGLSDSERHTVAAQAQRDRVLLRAVLRPGEYLAPRDLLGGRGADHSSRERFFHGTDFPDRERLLDLYGIGRRDDPRYGLDVVYFRPRRPAGAAEGPVLRVELNRQLARERELLERVLGTLELAGDHEHPEPMPQLLADQIAKSSVSSVLEALIESSLIDLIDDADADAASLEVIRWLYEESRS